MQGAKAYELFIYHALLAEIRRALGFHAAYLIAKLSHALFELAFFTFANRLAVFIQALFGIHHGQNLAIAGAIEQRLRKNHPAGPITLALQPRLAGGELIEALDDDGEIGLGHRRIDTHDDIACLDPVSVPHGQFADNAAHGMLDFLQAGFHHQRTLRDDRTHNLGTDGPAAEDADEG